ncbi:hypothetical protein [Streptomyces sp. NPDC058424]|uniref:hypothetical protein n=1 Tax=Streptomyces sp. NPDC058424 TaxID=3346491 RepID=UPI003666E5E6
MGGGCWGRRRAEVDFPADHHQYWLIATLGADEEALQPAEPKDDGLLDVSRKDRAAHIHTHTQYADIHLVLEFHDQAPSLSGPLPVSSV